VKNILIIGCGAIAQTHHIPVLKKQNVNLFLCDTNPDILSKKLSSFPFSTNYNDFINEVDGAFICTNHSSHFPIAHDLLSKKINVLIEKPITVTVSECESLMAFEKEFIVSAGYFRRYIENFKILKEIISHKKYGPIKEIKIYEGGVYGWPAMSNSFWKKESAGGGVLIDTGSHSVDLINFLLDNKIVLESYKDDAIDGIETNAELELSSNNSTIYMSLSRTRPMSNTIRIDFEHAFIELDATNGAVIMKHETIDENFGIGEYPDDLFTKQARAWIGSSINKDSSVSASEVCHTVKIIEQCYSLEDEPNY
jgi:predicted dehydrogenase